MMYKIPVCYKCSKVLKGKVPEETKVICFFCNNPGANEDDDENVVLKSVDVK